MSSPQLLDIEPGGENTQYADSHNYEPFSDLALNRSDNRRYESTHIFVDPPEKQTGQLGGR